MEQIKLEQAAAIRKQAEELIGHKAQIVPSGTATWVEGWVKTTQVDFRPKTPCVLVVVEGEDKKLYRRTFGNPLLKVDLESEKRDMNNRTRVPQDKEQIEEALKKAKTQLESIQNKIDLLTKALEEAKLNKGE